MANTTVGVRERSKTADGRWRWSAKITVPEGKLKPADAARGGKFYLVWTEKGKKKRRSRRRTFESALKAARAKERQVSQY